MPIEPLVPVEVLTPDGDTRGLDRDGAALMIDGYLRRLCRQEALCRRVVGTIAAAFLADGGHHRLTFCRVDDYARERLGVSGRELRSLATVGSKLPALPAIAAAFERGDLSWSHVRLLVSVATPEDEARWLEIALTKRVRGLEREVRAARGSAAVEEAARSAVEDTAGDEIDGEPRATLRIRCPRWVTTLFRDVVELARKVAGEELSLWRAAEAIAAEGIAGSSEPQDPEPLWKDLLRKRAAHTPPPPSGREYPIWESVAEAIPFEVETLARDLGAAGALELDRRMREALRAMRSVDWQMGRLLRMLSDYRLLGFLGFASPTAYASERLGLSNRKVRALIAVERKGWAAPALGRAYRSGEISWVRALAILPVVNEQDAPAWVARASRVTVRRLLREVEWSLEWSEANGRRSLRPPPELGAILERPPWQMCARQDGAFVDREVAITAPESVAALFLAAVRSHAAPWESTWRGLATLLEHVRTTWEALPRHRDPIFERDGWRCAVPACSSRRNLQDHHVVFRSRGGTNERTNRITLCAWHHLHGIHAGRIRATGHAPETIEWALGIRPRGEPLARLFGEVYVLEGSALVRERVLDVAEERDCVQRSAETADASGARTAPAGELSVAPSEGAP